MQVSFGNVSLFLYDSHDIVSDMLKGNQHAWETHEVQEVLWGLQQYRSPLQQEAARAIQQSLPGLASIAAASHADAGSSSSSDDGSSIASSQQHEQQQPLFVDVGANIGWFMLNAAAAGARVLAFEGTGAAVQVGFTHY